MRSNIYDMTYDLSREESTGAFTPFMRYQVDGYNQAYQYNVLLPDQPVRLTVSNFSIFAAGTYDINLSPA